MYFSIILWLLKSAYRVSRRQFVLLQVLQLITVLAEIGIAGLLLFAFRQFEVSGGSQSFTLTPFLGLLVMIGVLLCLQAALRFTVERRVTTLFRVFEQRTIADVVAKVSALSLADMMKFDMPIDRRHVLRFLQMDTRFCGMALRSLVRFPVPALTFIVSMLFLTFFNPMLAAVLVACLLFFIPLIAHINRQAIDISGNFEAATGEMAAVKRQMADDALDIQAAPRIDKLTREKLQGSAFSGYMDVLQERLILAARAGVLTSTFAAFAIVAVVATFGWQALNGLQPWSNIIIYFLIVRFILGALQQVSVLFASLNRFFVQVSRLHGLLTMQPASKQVGETVPQLVETTAHVEALENSSLTLKPGEVVFMIGAQPSSHRTCFEGLAALGYAVNELKSSIGSHAIHLADEDHEPEDSKEKFRIDILPEKVRHWMMKIRGPQSFKHMTMNVNARKQMKQFRLRARSGGWNGSGKWDAKHVRFMTGLAETAVAGAPNFIVINVAALERMRNDQIQRLLTAFPKSVLVVYVHRYLRRASRFGIDRALFVNGARLMAIDDITDIRDTRPRFQELLDRDRLGDMQEQVSFEA